MQDHAEKLQDILLQLERLRGQVDRLVGHVESEKGTLGRETKRLREEIDRVENNMKDVMYGKDGMSGVIIELDRLKQESLERRRIKRQLMGIWVVLGGILIKWLIDFLAKNKL